MDLEQIIAIQTQYTPRRNETGFKTNELLVINRFGRVVIEEICRNEYGSAYPGEYEDVEVFDQHAEQIREYLYSIGKQYATFPL